MFPEFAFLVFPEFVFLEFPELVLFNWGQDLLEGLSGRLMVFVSWSTVITDPIVCFLQRTDIFILRECKLVKVVGGMV